MSQEILQERLFEALINGDRSLVRQITTEVLEARTPPSRVITDLYWPTYELVERLFRSDQLTRLSHHMATRLLRVTVDQISGRLARAGRNGQRIFAVCGPREGDELGAQMAVDLLESGGFDVSFAGGGIANDEVLSYVHENRPDFLVMFPAGPSELPELRQLIDTLGEIGACPNMHVAVGGGVFNRADGLAEEIGADLWAADPLELVEILTDPNQLRLAVEQRVARKQRRRLAA